jgi:hypothetical protein
MISAQKQGSTRICYALLITVIFVFSFVLLACTLRDHHFLILYISLVLILISGLIALMYVVDLQVKYILESLVKFMGFGKETANEALSQEIKTEGMTESRKRK